MLCVWQPFSITENISDAAGAVSDIHAINFPVKIIAQNNIHTEHNVNITWLL